MKKIIVTLLLIVIIAGMFAPMASAEPIGVLNYSISASRVIMTEEGTGSFSITVPGTAPYAGVQYKVRLPDGVDFDTVSYNPGVTGAYYPQNDSDGDSYFSTGMAESNRFTGALTCTVNITYTGEVETTITIMEIKQYIIKENNRVDSYYSERTTAVTLVPNNIANDATLSGLSIPGVTLTPAFNPNITNYAARVDNEVESVTVEATPNNKFAEIDGVGAHTLDVGENEINVTVTAETGVKKPYKIVITRPSNDAALSSLTISSGILTPAFNPDITKYTASVIAISVDVFAIPRYEGATVSGIGSYVLGVGDNEITVTVTAADGTTNTYTIVITRRSSSGGSPEGSSIGSLGNVGDVSEPVVPLSGAFPFTDVKIGDWFYEDVLFMWEKGLMNGTSDTLFSPNGLVTRGMVVTVLYRMEGAPDVSEADIPFNDVREGIYYTDAIKWAAVNDIILGYGDGRFGPGDNVTREQLAAILYRYQVFADNIPPNIAETREFADANSISEYAKENVNKLVMQGIINGKPNNIFDPKGNATRAEYAAMLHRYLDK